MPKRKMAFLNKFGHLPRFGDELILEGCVLDRKINYQFQKNISILIFVIKGNCNMKKNLVTWMARTRDPDFLENVIYALDCKCKEEIENIYYLFTDDETCREKLKEVKQRFGKKIKEIPVKISDPSSHSEILKETQRVLEPLLPQIGDACVNITGGTPTMGTIWIVLKTGDFFRGRAKFYSAQKEAPSKERGRCVPKEEQDIRVVDFEPPSFLNFVRKREDLFPSQEPLDPGMARSPARKKMQAELDAFAQMWSPSVPLFLRGERGVGKTTAVKKLLAVQKNVKEEAVISLVCSVLSGDSRMAEDELFGHKKGAFTGANNEKKGLIEEANGGILFLDEIQDMPKIVQRKILNTIEEKDHPYTKLGSSTKSFAKNVLFVFASNLPDEELKKVLYPDFYDRISYLSIYMPPLRECQEDLHNDWNEQWKRARRKDPLVPEIAPWNKDIEDFLVKSGLPGNFRSLTKLALYWNAWYGKKDFEDIKKEIEFVDYKPSRDMTLENVKEMLEEITIKMSSVREEFNINNFPEFQISYDDTVQRIKKYFSEWAIKKYGSKEKAARKVGCCAKTLGNQ